jgi:hypothetical protein
MSTYNVYPSWIRRFEKDHKRKIKDLLDRPQLLRQMGVTNGKILMQELNFFKSGKALFINSMEEFNAIQNLHCEKVSFAELIKEPLDLIVACPIESEIAPFIIRVCWLKTISQEHNNLYGTYQEIPENIVNEMYCMMVFFKRGEKKKDNYYVQSNFSLTELNEHINNGTSSIDEGSIGLTLDDDEMEKSIMAFFAKLIMFMKAAPELFVNGLPQIMLQHTKLMEGRPKITFKLPPSDDWKNSHYRRMHVRQLWAERFYQGQYAHLKAGERMIMIKATVVKRMTHDDNKLHLPK